MKRTSFRWALPGVAAAIIALGGCAAGNEGSSAADDGGLSGTLAGGGSSAQEAAQNAWIAGFQTANPNVTVTYDPVGSGGGREGFISGGFPFAGSDAYLTDEGGELGAAAEQCGSDPIEVPNYVSPIAVIFNVDGVDELRLSPATLAGIFAGKITEWDDAAIKADNPGATLPSATINAATLMGLEADLGSLEPGKLADLVVTTTDPLAFDGLKDGIAQVWKAGSRLIPAT